MGAMPFYSYYDNAIIMNHAHSIGIPIWHSVTFPAIRPPTDNKNRKQNNQPNKNTGRPPRNATNVWMGRNTWNAGNTALMAGGYNAGFVLLAGGTDVLRVWMCKYACPAIMSLYSLGSVRKYCDFRLAQILP